VAWLFARDILSATAINRRLAAALALVFAAHALLAIGTWLADIDPATVPRWNMFLTAIVVATTAVTIEGWLWPVALAYLVGFFVASRDLSLVWLAGSASNAVFTLQVGWRLLRRKPR
jgi:hypothetical protein